LAVVVVTAFLDLPARETAIALHCWKHGLGLDCSLVPLQLFLPFRTQKHVRDVVSRPIGNPN